MIVPSAPLYGHRSSNNAKYTDFYVTHDGHLAYGKERGPWRAGIGRGGEFAHVIQSEITAMGQRP